MTESAYRGTLLLDFDGPINVDRAGGVYTMEKPVHFHKGEGLVITYHIRWNPDLLRELCILSEVYKIRILWSTSWVDDIDVLEKLLDFYAARGEIAFSRKGQPHKLLWPLKEAAYNEQCLRGPTAWVDDELDRGVKEVQPHHLQIGPDPKFGLEQRHVDALFDWAQRLY